MTEATHTERALLLIFDNLHSSGFSYLLNNGSIFSCFFLLLILFASATLKNWGATSTSHFGPTAVTLWQYSRVVKISSWYTSHSGLQLNKAEDEWMYPRQAFCNLLLGGVAEETRADCSTDTVVITSCKIISCLYLFKLVSATFVAIMTFRAPKGDRISDGRAE